MKPLLRSLIALACVFFLHAPGHAQSVTLPPSISVKANRPIFVSPVIDGDDVRWQIDEGLDDWIKLLPADIAKNFGSTKIFYADKGTYTVKAWTAKFVNGKAKLSDVATMTIIVEGGVPPPLPPDPPKPPLPPDPPAPIPLAGFRVMIVYDPATLTTAQEGIVFGKKVRDYLQAKCVVGKDGKTKEFRIYQSGLDVSAEVKWIGDTMQRHPGQKAWMVVSDGTKGYDGPLPANADEAISILSKIGGQ